MSGTKRNVFVVFVFTEMTILIGLLGIQGSRPITSSTPEMDETAEVNRSFTVYACEKTELTISCKENESIHIVYAYYGRISEFCYNSQWQKNLNCSANDSLSIVRSQCSGLSNCTVHATNSIFGDPCDQTLKYLRVTYQCQSGNMIVPPDDETTSSTDLLTSSMITSSMSRESPTSPCNGSLCRAEQKGKVTNTTRPCKSNHGVVDLSESVSNDTLQLQDKLENLSTNFSLVLFHELMNGLERAPTGGGEFCGGDLAALAKIMVGVINLTESKRMMNSSDSDRIYEVVVNTTSMLLQPNNRETWKDLPKTNQSSTAARLLWSVESSLAILAKSINETRVLKSSCPGLNVLVDISRQKSFSTPLNWVSSYDKVDDLKPIMPEAENGLGHVTVALFDDVAQWLHVNESAPKSPDLNSTSAENDSWSIVTPEIVVNTRVISISIVSWFGKDAGLKEKVRYTLEHKEKNSNYSQPKCVYWKYSKESFEGHWSDEGCRNVTNCSDCSYTVCECDHLTNFAVLMSVSGHKMSSEHIFALSVITYIGCTISIVCLALAFITFFWFKGLQCDRNTIHKNLVFCLFISEVIFLLGIGQNKHKELCAVLAGSLHYFFLASFSWMFLEGVQLYVLLIEVFETEKSCLRWYYFSGYGAPALIVSISAVATYLRDNRYAAEDYCWLSTKNGLIWAFTGPVAVIIFMNSVMLGVAIHTMCKHSSTASSLKDQQKSRIDTIGSFVRGAVALMILLGSTWTAGFLYVNEESLFMAYIFTILNSLQGLFIFVFHCLTNEKVRKEYRRCIQRCTCLPEDVRIKYGGLSGSAALSTTPNQTNSYGVPNRKRNHSLTSSPFQNSSDDKGRVLIVISSPGECFSLSATSHKVKRHANFPSESTMLTDSIGIPSSD